jgi:predicted secreted Zn-dependent protease
MDLTLHYWKLNMSIRSSILVTVFTISHIGNVNAQGIGACFGFTNCTEVKYSVSGATAAEVKQQMSLLGPSNAWGQTKADFKGADTYVQSQNSDGKYYIKSIQIEPEFTITLPKWTGLSGASACLKQGWANMYSSLVNHEKKHAAIAVDYAGRMENAALNTMPADSSEALKIAAANEISPVLSAYNSAQDKFDLDTNHGAADPLDPIIFEDCN